jgi:hypothetical protein
LVLVLWYTSVQAEPPEDSGKQGSAAVASSDEGGAGASAAQKDADAFARLALETLRSAGLQGELRYDAEHFTIIVPELEGQHGLTIFLGNFYGEYRASPPGQRTKTLERLVRFAASPPAGPVPYAQARSALLPVVRPRSYFEMVQLMDFGDPKDGGVKGNEVPVVWRPLGEVLGVALVYDTPDAMKYVGSGDLSGWGTTFEKALAEALENLRQKSQEELVVMAPGTCRGAWRDSYGSSRLLLDEVVRRCPVHGDPVVMVPNRDELLVTGSRDDEGLLKAAEWALAAYAVPRPVDGRALRRTAKGWEPFMPSKGSKSWLVFRKLLVASQASEYATQAEALDEQHQRQGVDISVGKFIPYEDEHGNAFSQAIWVRDIDTLLPRVDMLIFMDSKLGPDAPPVAVVRWDVVQRDVGGLLVPEKGLYPVRYRLKGFPSAEQIARWKKDPSVMDVP